MEVQAQTPQWIINRAERMKREAERLANRPTPRYYSARSSYDADLNDKAFFERQDRERKERERLATEAAQTQTTPAS